MGRSKRKNNEKIKVGEHINFTEYWFVKEIGKKQLYMSNKRELYCRTFIKIRENNQEQYSDMHPMTREESKLFEINQNKYKKYWKYTWGDWNEHRIIHDNIHTPI